jgi:hypothetical protein
MAQGFNNMEVFAHYLANNRSVVDFVKSVNKLPADQNGDWPLILFASIRLLQVMRHWTIEHQCCGLPIVHNELTQDELMRILQRMEEVGGKHHRHEAHSASLAQEVWLIRQELAHLFGRLQGTLRSGSWESVHPIGLHLA